MTKRNVVSWTIVIGAYVQMKQPEEVVEVFRRMQVDEGIEPDGVALLSVLSACGYLGAVDQGEWVQCLWCIEKAVEVFEGMQEKSVVTWATLITSQSERSPVAVTYVLLLIQAGFLDISTTLRKLGLIFQETPYKGIF